MTVFEVSFILFYTVNHYHTTATILNWICGKTVCQLPWPSWVQDGWKHTWSRSPLDILLPPRWHEQEMSYWHPVNCRKETLKTFYFKVFCWYWAFRMLCFSFLSLNISRTCNKTPTYSPPFRGSTLPMQCLADVSLLSSFVVWHIYRLFPYMARVNVVSTAFNCRDDC